MLKFSELSNEAQDVAVDCFVTAAREMLGKMEINKIFVKDFLSFSKIHRFDDKGKLLGKLVRKRGTEVFKQGHLF